MTSPLHPSVRALWCAFNEPFEGRVPWMYLDVRGLVTVGVGCLIDPVESALPLPWRLVDAVGVLEQGVRLEWQRVKAMTPGLAAFHYREPSSLHLSDAAINDLALRRYDAIAAAILARWPDAATWPDEAFTAAASMGYALGTSSTVRPGLLSPAWPHLHAALDAQDWEAAARECVMRGAGLDRRNSANAALFRAAAGASG